MGLLARGHCSPANSGVSSTHGLYSPGLFTAVQTFSDSRKASIFLNIALRRQEKTCSCRVSPSVLVSNEPLTLPRMEKLSYSANESEGNSGLSLHIWQAIKVSRKMRQLARRLQNGRSRTAAVNAVGSGVRYRRCEVPFPGADISKYFSCGHFFHSGVGPASVRQIDTVLCGTDNVALDLHCCSC